MLTLALLEEQKRLGFAIFYAAGTLNVASWLGGRIVVMSQGRAIEEGPFERLTGAQTHAYTQTLFRTLPKLSTEKPPRTIARGETLLRVQGLELTSEKVTQGRSRELISFELRRGASLALVGEEDPADGLWRARSSASTIRRRGACCSTPSTSASFRRR